MGKIRVKTIGIEEDEKDQKKKAKERAEAKRIEAAKKAGQEAKAAEEALDDATASNATGAGKAKDAQEKETTVRTEAKTEKKTKKDKFKSKKAPHSKSYVATASLVDRNKTYTLAEALEILPKLKRAKFDETVELHINTSEKGVSGSLTLPHGTGKQSKIEIADHAKDPKKLEELVKKIESGQIDFDILIATPDSMMHLARVAKYLGPRGLMPNPKNGTVHPKPEEAAKKFAGGQINFKTEPKAPVMHLSVGKLSFGEKKLEDNITALIKAVQVKNIKSATLKSTMSPGIKLMV
jgi:large subunit ribosomal protein L1